MIQNESDDKNADESIIVFFFFKFFTGCTYLTGCSTRTYFARITKRFGKNLMRIMFLMFFHESDNAISKTDVFSGTVLREIPTVWV